MLNFETIALLSIKNLPCFTSEIIYKYLYSTNLNRLLAFANIFEETATCFENLTADFLAIEVLVFLSNLTTADSFNTGTLYNCNYHNN